MRKITYLLLNITFALSIICTNAVPFSGRLINSYYHYNTTQLSLFIIIITLSGIFSAFLLYSLKSLYKTFADNNPFVMKNIKFLNYISLCCGGITICYIVKCIFIFTPAALMVALMFGMSVLLAISLRDLFRKAVEYKEENDLTI